ncbi:PRAME family member 5 [Myotis davidii]|uniref:PRAME family member 5 n=1 Tax=Myotis davidii TaxID=225400 RepID=L5M6Y2_MYODS|nr:PRAME family member 5 [Myotis davidii]
MNTREPVSASLSEVVLGSRKIVKTALGLDKPIFCHLLPPLHLSPPPQALTPGTNRSISPQLRDFTIPENPLSVATVEKLLCHSAGLRSLERELYPVPLECYRTQGTVNQVRLALVRAELMGILRELGQPRPIFLGTKCCHKCGNSKVYDVEFS